MSSTIIQHVLKLKPYLVRRNSRGALPVYSDVRNGVTRYTIRNVDGHVDSLACDLRRSLASSSHPHRLTIKVHNQRHIILSGGRFKRDVMAWLTAKGF